MNTTLVSLFLGEEPYSPDQLYLINIGEMPDSSYNVLGELDKGAHSTVWLCRVIGCELQILTL